MQDNAAGESAERTRRAINFMLKRGATIGSVAGGLVAATDLQTTYQGAGLKVEISAGEAMVPNNVSASGTGYYLRLSATSTVTLPAANSSNNRVEAAVAYVKDESYSGSGNEGLVEVLPGNAKAGASLANLEGAPGQSGGPALPKNVIVLSYILVSAGVTTISNANIKNVAEQVTFGLPFMKPVIQTATFTATPGEAAFCEPSVGTVKMPAPTKGALIELSSVPGGTVTVANTGGGKFYGDFIEGANSLTLLPNQHVWLLGSGTNWFIIAGEPKREQTYQSISTSNATPFEVSGTRLALLILECSHSGSEALTEVKVGGVKVGQVGAGGAAVEVFSFTCLVPPGVKAEYVSTGAGVNAKYLLL